MTIKEAFRWKNNVLKRAIDNEKNMDKCGHLWKSFLGFLGIKLHWWYKWNYFTVFCFHFIYIRIHLCWLTHIYILSTHIYIHMYIYVCVYTWCVCVHIYIGFVIVLQVKCFISVYGRQKYMFCNDSWSLNNASNFQASQLAFAVYSWSQTRPYCHHGPGKRIKTNSFESCFKSHSETQKCDFTISIISYHLKGFCCLVYYAKLIISGINRTPKGNDFLSK